MYGTLVSFLASACPTAMDWMDECDLRPWVDRMNARIPMKDIVPTSVYVPAA